MDELEVMCEECLIKSSGCHTPRMQRKIIRKFPIRLRRTTTRNHRRMRTSENFHYIASDSLEDKLKVSCQNSVLNALAAQGRAFSNEINEPYADVTSLREGGFIIPFNLGLGARDYKLLEEFKKQCDESVPGPFMVEHDPIKGYYVKTLKYLRKSCLVAFYAGDLDSEAYRKACLDSDMLRICSSDKHRDANERRTLLVCSNKRGNISRFFSGINNSQDEARALINIRCDIVKHKKNLLQVIFYTTREVREGEELIWDYNQGDELEEDKKRLAYATDDFV